MPTDAWINEAEEFYQQFYDNYLRMAQGEKDLAQVFIGKLRTEHPTAQQNFWRFVFLIARDLSNDHPYTDGRNEMAIQLVDHISDFTGHLPII